MENKGKKKPRNASAFFGTSFGICLFALVQELHSPRDSDIGAM
jgi:hypothetical protein